MAEETLVESLIEDSINLVKQLDAQGDTPTKVLWYFYADAEEWKLLVAGPAFDRFLPKDEAPVYQKIAQALAKTQLDSLTIADVKVVRTDDDLLSATKYVLKTAPTSVVRARFRDNTFNGVFVRDMLVLRAA